MTSPETEATGAAAPCVDGLGALDRERAASLADEGGVAAAAVEGQENQLRVARRRLDEGSWRTTAVVAIGTAVAWLVLRRH